jgi:hypothetical protein
MRALRFLRLPSAERRLLIKAALLHAVIRLGLEALPFHTLWRLLAKLAKRAVGSQKTDPSSAERIA